MKKQLIILYIFLFFFLSIFSVALYTLLNMDTQPQVPKDYVAYKEQQEEVTVIVDVPESEATEPETKIYLDFDLEELLAANADFDSWLMLPDTDISFPVLLGPDNDYYLYRDLNREYSVYGSLYFDILSTPNAQNRVIYGHNMGANREEMFSKLVLFQEQEYAQEHIYAYLSADPSEPADVYELYAVVNLNIYDDPDFDYAQPNFETSEDREAFIAYLRERSIYETDFIPDGKLLVLSTCNRQYGGNNRLLICYGQRLG